MTKKRGEPTEELECLQNLPLHLGRATDAPWSKGCLFVIGGETLMDDISADLEAYDPVTCEWFELAPISVARRGAKAAVLGESLYVVGGTDWNWITLKTMERYDMRDGKWYQDVAEMSYTKIDFELFPFQGKLYAFGRQVTESDMIDNVLEVYDPTTNKWTLYKFVQHPNRPIPWELHVRPVADLGDKIYIIGYAFAKRLMYLSGYFYPQTISWDLLETKSEFGVSQEDAIYHRGVFFGWKYSNCKKYFVSYDSRSGLSTAHGNSSKDTNKIIELDGLIYAFSNQNREEADDTVRIFNPVTLHWTPGKPLLKKRAFYTIAAYRPNQKPEMVPGPI